MFALSFVDLEIPVSGIPITVCNPRGVSIPAAAESNRLATMADGWNPVAVPVEGMKQMFDGVREMAKRAGRDPNSLRAPDP